MGETILTEAEK